MTTDPSSQGQLGATATSPRIRYVAAVPTETFTHSATAAAPVEAVWASLDEPETWEAIGGVDRVFDPVIDDQGRLRGFSFDTVAAGRRYVGTARPDQRVEGRLMAWRIQNSEMRGTTRVELTEVEDGTAITVTLEVESVGLLSSMLFPVVASAIGSGLPNAVGGFAAGLER